MRNFFNFNFSEKTSDFLILCFSSIGALSLLIALMIMTHNESRLHRYDEYAYHIQRDNIELMYEGARSDLVQCIDSTIRVYAPTTCMNGLEILRQCESHNIDLFFVLAQGHIESHFGTRGMALKTNSVFNVLAYDGKSYDKINPNGKYKHPDLSIQPYLKLLKTRYLVDGKTEMDLMLNYVDKDGHRYASSKEYETNLTNAYKRYTTSEPLAGKFLEYTKYKILTGK